MGSFVGRNEKLKQFGIFEHIMWIINNIAMKIANNWIELKDEQMTIITSLLIECFTIADTMDNLETFVSRMSDLCESNDKMIS